MNDSFAHDFSKFKDNISRLNFSEAASNLYNSIKNIINGDFTEKGAFMIFDNSLIFIKIIIIVTIVCLAIYNPIKYEDVGIISSKPGMFFLESFLFGLSFFLPILISWAIRKSYLSFTQILADASVLGIAFIILNYILELSGLWTWMYTTPKDKKEDFQAVVNTSAFDNLYSKVLNIIKPVSTLSGSTLSGSTLSGSTLSGSTLSGSTPQDFIKLGAGLSSPTSLGSTSLGSTSLGSTSLGSTPQNTSKMEPGNNCKPPYNNAVYEIEEKFKAGHKGIKTLVIVVGSLVGIALLFMVVSSGFIHDLSPEYTIDYIPKFIIFIIEMLLYGVISAAPIFLAQYNRNEFSSKTTKDFLMQTLKCSAFFIFLQVSGLWGSMFKDQYGLELDENIKLCEKWDIADRIGLNKENIMNACNQANIIMDLNK